MNQMSAYEFELAYLHRVDANGGWRAQHDSISAVKDGIGNI